MDKFVNGTKGSPDFGRRILLPGEYALTRSPYLLSTMLGSCVSVCFSSRDNLDSAMVHYLLDGEYNVQGEQGRYGRPVLTHIIQNLIQLGNDPRRIEARVYGGADMFAPLRAQASIGQRNVKMAHDILSEYHIAIVEEDTRGSIARRVFFYTHQRRVEIFSNHPENLPMPAIHTQIHSYAQPHAPPYTPPQSPPHHAPSHAPPYTPPQSPPHHAPSQPPPQVNQSSSHTHQSPLTHTLPHFASRQEMPLILLDDRFSLSSSLAPSLSQTLNFRFIGRANLPFELVALLRSLRQVLIVMDIDSERHALIHHYLHLLQESGISYLCLFVREATISNSSVPVGLATVSRTELLESKSANASLTRSLSFGHFSSSL